MFAFLLAPLRREIDNIKKIVTKHDLVRAFVDTPVGFGDSDIPNLEVLLRYLRSDCPTSIDWKVFDHCATVIRLYAIYEKFVRDLIQEWLLKVPVLYERYDDLPEAIRTAHRVGVADVLPKAGGERYPNLSEAVVIGGIASGLSGGVVYYLLKEAFIIDESNYRGEVVNRLFGRCGIPNAWGWIGQHPSVLKFLQDVRGGAESAESEMRAFVQYRNAAAHDAVDQTVGSEELIKIADFILAITNAMADLIMKSVIERLVVLGRIRQIGEVIRQFSNGVIGVTFAPGVIEDNELLWVHQGNACFATRIEKLEIDNTQYKSSFSFGARDIGLQVTRSVRVGAAVYRPVRV